MPTTVTDGLIYVALDSVTVPVDADARNAASVTAPGVGFQALADRSNNLVNRVGGPDGSGEHLYLNAAGVATVRSRVRIFSPFAMTEGILQVMPDHDEGGASIRQPAQFWTVAAFVSGGTAHSRTSQHDFARLVMDLSALLPDGATLTQVEAIVTPGAARAGANRMNMFLSRQTPNFGTPAIPVALGPLFSVFDDTTGSVQVLDTGAMTEAINRTSDLVLQIIAGDDAGTNKDDVHAIRVSYDDPGPQNF